MTEEAQYICPKCNEPGERTRNGGMCRTCWNAKQREIYWEKKKKVEAVKKSYCKTEFDRIMTEFLSKPWVNNYG